MTVETVLDLVGAAAIFLAAVIPAYLSIRIRGNMGKVTLALTAFIVVHGIYHIARLQGLESMADSLFEPLSVALLVVFGCVYLGFSRKKKEVDAE